MVVAENKKTTVYDTITGEKTAVIIPWLGGWLLSKRFGGGTPVGIYFSNYDDALYNAT